METQSSMMQLFMQLGSSGGQSLNSLMADDALGNSGFGGIYDSLKLQNLDTKGLPALDAQLSTPENQLNALSQGVKLSNNDLAMDSGLIPDGHAEVVASSGNPLPLIAAMSGNATAALNADQFKSVDGKMVASQNVEELEGSPEDQQLHSAIVEGDSPVALASDPLMQRQQVVSQVLQQANTNSRFAGEGRTNSNSLPTSRASLASDTRVNINNGKSSDKDSGITTELSEGFDEGLTEEQDRFLGANPLAKEDLSKTRSATQRPLAGNLDLGPSASATSTQAQINTNAAQSSALVSADVLVGSTEPAELLQDDQMNQDSIERQQQVKADVEKTLQLSKGQQAWGDAIGERITMAAAKDVQQATIHLDPPELGAMELKLEINDERQVQVQVQVQSPQVKEALESSATRLREMFEGEGIELADLDVSDQSMQQGESEDENNEDSANGQNGDFDGETDVLGAEVMANVKTSNGLLDTYV